jgi:opacity protein-like surface antigen
MRTLKLTTLALALAGAFPSQAADPAAAPAPAGMTEQQLADFNRIAVKTEALEDSRDAAGLKSLKISGYMDPSYVYNFNKQRGSFQFLVPASKEGYGTDNGYFGTVSLDLQKETDSGTKFRLNLIPKRGTGDFNDGSIVNEASVSIPMDGYKIFAGQIPDWSGYEYQAPYGAASNLLVTHNLLFDFTLPYYYTGVGLEVPLDRYVLKLMVANFNAPIRQLGESVPMFVFRGDYTPKGTDYWGYGFAGAVGYKNNTRPFADAGFGLDANGVALDAAGHPVSTKDTLYLTAEIDGWYTRGDVTFNAHLNYGMQKKAAITAAADGALRDSQWAGVSVLGAYKFTPVLQGILRADFIYDQKNGGGLMDYAIPDPANGVGPDQQGGDPNKGADKYCVTAGLSYAINTNVVFKAEYRYDGATKKVFGNKDALTGGADPKYLNHNSIIASSLVVGF